MSKLRRTETAMKLEPLSSPGSFRFEEVFFFNARSSVMVFVVSPSDGLTRELGHVLVTVADNVFIAAEHPFKVCVRLPILQAIRLRQDTNAPAFRVPIRNGLNSTRGGGIRRHWQGTHDQSLRVFNILRC
jgi:hypothetical protein